MPAPALPSVPYPLINGHRFSFSSLQIQLAAKKTIGFKSISYKSSLKPAIVRGTNAQVVGRTRGVHESSGELVLYQEDWADFLAVLSTLSGFTSGLSPGGLPPGFMEVSWDAAVGYSETPVSPVQLNLLKGCRITDIDESHEEGEEALSVKLSLSILMIQYNGAYPVNIPLT